MTGVERTVERVRATGEIFTPTPLVIEMLREVDLERLAPGRTVLDPACGDGQFLAAAKWIKVVHFGATEDAALADLYGVDIMRDNVDLCRRRLGGGTILMGDTLHPARPLPGQTDAEHELMLQLFGTEEP
jgi:SAM-dependent methyltransferase